MERVERRTATSLTPGSQSKSIGLLGRSARFAGCATHPAAVMASSGTAQSAEFPSHRATGKSNESAVSWRQVVAAVAAAAGGAAWVSAVGSGAVALRLRQADLPIEPVVALMSAEHRFAIGAGILIAPLLAGFIGFLADWKLGGDKIRKRQALAAGTILVGAGLMYFVLRPPFESFALECGAVAVAVPFAFEVLKIRGGEAP